MNNFFDKIFCINLDHRTDRWELATNFFTEHNISAERFSALKNDNAVMGCKLSHQGIIRIAKEQNLKNVLIFEDDFYFKDYSLSYIEEAFQQLPNQWDIFYLGYNPTERLISFSENLYKINGAWCCHAYVVNNTFYDTILNDLSNLPIDVHIKQFQKTGNMYGLKKNYCLQRNNFSDLDQKYNANGDIIEESIRMYS
jgi:GR25 family glycosyltransferase involved in LPS biosynthesis